MSEGNDGSTSALPSGTPSFQWGDFDLGSKLDTASAEAAFATALENALSQAKADATPPAFEPTQPDNDNVTPGGVADYGVFNQLTQASPPSSDVSSVGADTSVGRGETARTGTGSETGAETGATSSTPGENDGSIAHKVQAFLDGLSGSTAVPQGLTDLLQGDTLPKLAIFDTNGDGKVDEKDFTLFWDGLPSDASAKPAADQPASIGAE